MEPGFWLSEIRMREPAKTFTEAVNYEIYCL